MKLAHEHEAPQAEPTDLVDDNAIIVGTPTRFWHYTAQMRNFWDQTGASWGQGALIGKVGAAFTSTASQQWRGGDHRSRPVHTTLLHHGMAIVGLPYSFPGNVIMSEASGGTPYGAATLAGLDGSRQPSENELAGARFQGAHVAGITKKLASFDPHSNPPQRRGANWMLSSACPACG